MLALSDTPIEVYLPFFAHTNVAVAFLVLTPTGYEKSIMDATAPMRQFLLDAKIHDYTIQRQGPQNKVIVPAYFVNPDGLIKTYASLYRPVTKKGDPRIWFGNLKKYCHPCNLLAIISIQNELYVFNLSNSQITDSLKKHGFCYSVLEEAAQQGHAVSQELLKKLHAIHKQGFLPSITSGDPGVGDTLEHALGISRNNRKQPDYKGIELKATRLTRNGVTRAKTRSTLFTKVPDDGLSYREIVEQYGKWQTPRGSSIARLQLYETCRCSRPNAYNLILNVDQNNDQLNLLVEKFAPPKYVSSWRMQNLRETLLLKHHETFWVKATSIMQEGIEYFRYDHVVHTKSPNVSLLAPLLETDKITVDLAAHFNSDGKWRDHGVLFKMLPEDLSLLLGETTEYTL